MCLKHQISASVLASGQFLKVLGTVGQSRESSLIDFQDGGFTSAPPQHCHLFRRTDTNSGSSWKEEELP